MVRSTPPRRIRSRFGGGGPTKSGTPAPFSHPFISSASLATRKNRNAMRWGKTYETYDAFGNTVLAGGKIRRAQSGRRVFQNSGDDHPPITVHKTQIRSCKKTKGLQKKILQHGSTCRALPGVEHLGGGLDEGGGSAPCCSLGLARGEASLADTNSHTQRLGGRHRRGGGGASVDWVCGHSREETLFLSTTVPRPHPRNPRLKGKTAESGAARPSRW